VLLRALQGRWAPSLLRGCFGRYQNVLRIILIDDASPVTTPKEAAPQGLNRVISQARCMATASINQSNFLKTK
jgi:hypothetical protein